MWQQRVKDPTPYKTDTVGVSEPSVDMGTEICHRVAYVAAAGGGPDIL